MNPGLYSSADEARGSGHQCCPATKARVFGHNAVALAARGTDVAGEDRACRGYAVSQRRKRIEEPFGWGKTIGELARPMLRGVEKLGFKFTLTMAGYNLIRLPKLIAAQA